MLSADVLPDDLLAEALQVPDMLPTEKPVSKGPASPSPIQQTRPPIADDLPAAKPGGVATPKPNVPDDLDAQPTGDTFHSVKRGSSDGDSYREQQTARRQKQRKRLATNLMGHVVASTMGLVLGYIILCWLMPQADFLKLFNR